MVPAPPGTGLHAGLDPSPDQARRLLRSELTDPDYVEGNLMDRVLTWLVRQFETVSAQSVGPIGLVLISLVLAVVAVAVILLVVRTRRSGREAGAGEDGVLPSTRISAQEHRAAALAALTGGDPATAVLEAFRAQAMRMVESGQIDDVPGATATELVSQMGRIRPDLALPLAQGARLFDEVHYGEAEATAAQVQTLLDLDDRLHRSPR